MSLNRPFALGWGGSVVLGCFMLISACATQQELITKREDDLSAAGFVVKPANTPERQQMLARLPPNKVIQRTHDDAVHYVYADPVVCKCLYVGAQDAFAQFKRQEQQQKLADEQQMTAQMYQDPAWSWGSWGPWGPGMDFRYGPRGW